MTGEDCPVEDATILAAVHQTGKRAVTTSIEAALARCGEAQQPLNPFAALDEDGARKAARLLDQTLAEGRNPGSLAGVPVGVKDILNVAGLPTRWGSRLMEGAAPATADTVSVARLKAQGAVVVGKTTTTEFAHSMMAMSPLTGKTVNPWNPNVTCGGSSSGAGVSVAAGLVPLSLATDAGASTRLPAACTGVLGLKPTLGRVPHDLVPEGFANFIHLGMLARSVADMALMLDAMAGPAASDPHSLAVPAPKALEAVNGAGSLEGVRVACFLKAGNARISAEIEELTRRSADRLADLGATVTYIEPKFDNPEGAWRVLQQSNWAARFADNFAEIEARVDASLAAGIREGLGYSGLQLQRALVKRTAFFRQVQALFQEADLLLTPVCSRSALAADHPVLEPIEIDGETVGDMRREWTPYLSLFDLTGHPALSIPAGFARDGSPVGVQLVGPWYAEAALLAAAAAYERQYPWPKTAPKSLWER